MWNSELKVGLEMNSDVEMFGKKKHMSIMWK